MNKMKTTSGLLAATFVLLFSCNKSDQFIPAIVAENAAKLGVSGHLYTISNDAGQNAILIFNQLNDGSVEFDSAVSTGGAGSGAGLGSQGSVVLSKDHQWLFAVNAGDNTISSFLVGDEGQLQLAGVVSSGGEAPISLTVHQEHLYVVNTGSDNISGFMIGAGGTLTPIPGSTQPLSANNADPAQISFRPNGKGLLVTEKATNRLTSYMVDEAGVAGPPVSIKSRGETPFGFDFGGKLNPVVSNAEGGNEGESSVTSYFYSGDKNDPLDFDGPEANGQTAACWLVISKAGGTYAFVTNTGSNTISTYVVQDDGQIALQHAVAGVTAVEPIDVALSGGNQAYVYNINATSHSITAFERNADGTLTLIEEETGLPDFAVGLAAF